jgi:hypothetical protein
MVNRDKNVKSPPKAERKLNRATPDGYIIIFHILMRRTNLFKIFLRVQSLRYFLLTNLNFQSYWNSCYWSY